jgi:hypothetical protein
MNAIKSRLLADGLSTFVNRNLVFICPPLCITWPELSAGLEIIEHSLTGASA